MVAVPRKAVGMMLGESQGGEKGPGDILGGFRDILRGLRLPGVDGDAHLQQGPQVDAWKGRAGR